jgi:hypothetical protein
MPNGVHDGHVLLCAGERQGLRTCTLCMQVLCGTGHNTDTPFEIEGRCITAKCDSFHGTATSDALSPGQQECKCCTNFCPNVCAQFSSPKNNGDSV